MAKKKQLVIGFVLDETGSMRQWMNATIDGFNEYLDARRTEDPDAQLILTLFNSENTREVFNGKVKDAPRLSQANYQPDHTTPLYDAVARGIRLAEAAASKGNPVLMVIQTDGLENASREFTQQQIFERVKQKREAGWTFIFLGADIDAFAVGAAMNMPQGNTLMYASADSVDMFAQVSRASSRYSAGSGKQNENLFGVTQKRERRIR